MTWRLEHAVAGRRQAGFTLLEVVVALIVFALVFGVVTQIIQTGFRQSRTAAETTTAALIARSLMERLGHDLPIADGTYEGEAEDGFRWQVEIVRAAVGESEASPIVLPYTVQIEVLWGEPGDEHSFELSTLRLAAAG